MVILIPQRGALDITEGKLVSEGNLGDRSRKSYV
jgi:hypothetical protein